MMFVSVLKSLARKGVPVQVFTTSMWLTRITGQLKLSNIAPGNIFRPRAPFTNTSSAFHSF